MNPRPLAFSRSINQVLVSSDTPYSLISFRIQATSSQNAQDANFQCPLTSQLPSLPYITNSVPFHDNNLSLTHLLMQVPVFTKPRTKGNIKGNIKGNKSRFSSTIQLIFLFFKSLFPFLFPFLQIKSRDQVQPPPILYISSYMYHKHQYLPYFSTNFSHKMLDSRSLDVISKFKLALLTRAEKPPRQTDLRSLNRGQKLTATNQSDPAALMAKIVEYNGTNHLVLTNDVIERSNYRNKRRWLEFYSTGANESSDEFSSESDKENDGNGKLKDGSDDEDENPLKKLRLSDILAPLAHPSELATHPAILKTYRLPCLATLASDLIHSIEVEQKTLNQFNKLLQVLDNEDWFYQLEENMELPVYDHGLDDSATNSNDVILDTMKEVVAPSAEANGAVVAVGSGSEIGSGTAAKIAPAEGTDPSSNDQNTESSAYKRITRGVSAEEKIKITDPFFALPKSLALFERQQQKQLEEEDEKDDDPLEVLKQDLRNYLQVSIQRQQECIKNLTSIRNGIVKADRYKRDLYRWGKEMSEKK